MAEQLGQRIGKAFLVEETSEGYSQNMSFNNAAITQEGYSQMNSMAAGVIPIRESVRVSFELN